MHFADLFALERWNKVTEFFVNGLRGRVKNDERHNAYGNELATFSPLHWYPFLLTWYAQVVCISFSSQMKWIHAEKISKIVFPTLFALLVEIFAMFLGSRIPLWIVRLDRCLFWIYHKRLWNIPVVWSCELEKSPHRSVLFRKLKRVTLWINVFVTKTKTQTKSNFLAASPVFKCLKLFTCKCYTPWVFLSLFQDETTQGR